MSYAGSQSLPFGQSLYPATLRQLLRARQRHSQSNFYVDGIELDMVTCVVHVVEIRRSGSKITYDVEDGSSGHLRAVQFIASESSLLPEESLREHVYVRLMGRLRVFNGRNELKVMHIRPVLDVHEPFFHCLDAMVSFLSQQKQNVGAGLYSVWILPQPHQRHRDLRLAYNSVPHTCRRRRIRGPVARNLSPISSIPHSEKST